MPAQSLMERIPLPSLQKYVCVSVAAFLSTLFFAWSHAEDHMMEVLNSTKNMTEQEMTLLFKTLTYSEYSQCLLLAISSQVWTVWTMVNMCYCVAAILGKGIQLAVFGALRVSEAQQLKERFWNFAFYKFIFIFGVLNVQYMNDAFMWAAWFSLVCALQLLAQLSKYRFEYLSCSPATPKSQHMKLLFLLVLILLISFCLVAASVYTAFFSDWNVFGFMVAECLLLMVRTLYVITKYTIYLVDINHDGLWETRGTLAYYTDLVCELLVLIIDLIHYLHMVIWSNIFVSMASIVLWMQVRFLFNEIQKRVSRHRNYLNVIHSMESRFSEATPDDIIKYDDNCAICWDKMQKARKLPCGHLFHNSCLRSWLAQDISCPTCRVSLSDQKPETETQGDAANEGIQLPNTEADGDVVRPRATDRQNIRRVNRTNHFFHFDASRYISWLPSFSVEVTHTINNGQAQPRQNTQLNGMAREVHNLFPNLSFNSIIEDLRSTHSVEITIDNILEGRLTIMAGDGDDSSSGESESEDSSYNSTDNMMEYINNLGDMIPVTEFTQAETPSSNDMASLPQDESSFEEDPALRHQLLQDRKADLQTKARQRFYDGAASVVPRDDATREDHEEEKNK